MFDVHCCHIRCSTFTVVSVPARYIFAAPLSLARKDVSRTRSALSPSWPSPVRRGTRCSCHSGPRPVRSAMPCPTHRPDRGNRGCANRRRRSVGQTARCFRLAGRMSPGNAVYTCELIQGCYNFSNYKHATYILS